MELENWRKTMSEQQMDAMLDEVFKKVFGIYPMKGVALQRMLIEKNDITGKELSLHERDLVGDYDG
jgi:hypothetical protein